MKTYKKEDTSGSGLYVYENRTNSEIMLPKPTNAGRCSVGAGEQFESDSFFMKWIGSQYRLLRLIEIKVPKEVKMERKLLLEQPAIVTTAGKIEHVLVEEPKKVSKRKKKKNEELTPEEEALLNEDPSEGVDILL